jgi:hypothetical protein
MDGATGARRRRVPKVGYAPMKRSLQTPDAEMDLARMLDDLADH